MKFKFDKHLEHQMIAIESIVKLFESGKNNSKSAFELTSFSPVIKNQLEIDEKTILENLKAIQEENKVSISSELDGLDFSVEMETGTGKTYVYLKTIFELHQIYNLKKFIILVPSVAIREGVLKTLEQTKEHFRLDYNTYHHYFAYDSKKLSKVRDFSHGNDIQIMVMTIQSFNSDNTIMRQKQDRFQGVPIDLVSETRPVIIMGEPQNMETDLAKSSIQDLKPLFRLRYSATHKNKYNLVYSLSPVEAYEKGLVKKIEVYGVEEDNSSSFIFRIRSFDELKAMVGIEVKESNGEYTIQDMILKSGDDLFRKSKGNIKYEGLRVNQVDRRVNTIELSNGKEYSLQEKSAENKEVIFRTQIRETILTHMEKQKKFGGEIKVLSLFFIDRVAHYIHSNSFIRKLFEEEFQKLQTKYEFFKKKDVSKVHNGYFSKEKEKGNITYKDTNGTTKADKEVYDLIMKNKEQLLSFSEETCFIFSHSALREGWDNPNVFQICTLSETNSIMKKRQEIGRGLRLCVSVNGDRIFDTDTNILTIIPNESYESFAGNLQKEYEQEGYGKTPKPVNRRERISIPFRKNFDTENIYFKELWQRIRKKTKYNINIKTHKLVENTVKKINELDVNNLVVRIRRAYINYDNDSKSIKYIHESESTGYALNKSIKIENILERIGIETGLTKTTIVQILSKINNLDLVFSNPEEFTRSCIISIKISLNELIINEGIQYIPTNDIWELGIFEDLNGYISKTIESKKGPYERVLFDSDGEKKFAESLELLPKVKLYIKLPPKFQIETPLGNYNPDWAIVVEEKNGDRLYLVRETKFVDDLNNLRPSESQKILCGKKHFESIGIDFKVSQKENLHDVF